MHAEPLVNILRNVLEGNKRFLVTGQVQDTLGKHALWELLVYPDYPQIYCECYLI